MACPARIAARPRSSMNSRLRGNSVLELAHEAQRVVVPAFARVDEEQRGRRVDVGRGILERGLERADALFLVAAESDHVREPAATAGRASRRRSDRCRRRFRASARSGRARARPPARRRRAWRIETPTSGCLRPTRCTTPAARRPRRASYRASRSFGRVCEPAPRPGRSRRRARAGIRLRDPAAAGSVAERFVDAADEVIDRDRAASKQDVEPEDRRERAMRVRDRSGASATACRASARASS